MFKYLTFVKRIKLKNMKTFLTAILLFATTCLSFAQTNHKNQHKPSPPCSDYRILGSLLKIPVKKHAARHGKMHTAHKRETVSQLKVFSRPQC